VADQQFAKKGVVFHAYDDEIRSDALRCLAEGWADSALKNGDFAGCSFGEGFELLGGVVDFPGTCVAGYDVCNRNVDRKAMLDGASVVQAANGFGAEIGSVKDLEPAVPGPFSDRVTSGNGEHRDGCLPQDALGGRGDLKAAEGSSSFGGEDEDADVFRGDNFFDLQVETSLAEFDGAWDFLLAYRLG